jgi:hypothetical protein
MDARQIVRRAGIYLAIRAVEKRTILKFEDLVDLAGGDGVGDVGILADEFLCVFPGEVRVLLGEGLVLRLLGLGL